MALAIGVDVGGTKVAAGVVDCEGRVTDRYLLPTPSTSPREVAAAIEIAVAALRRDRDVAAVGIGAAGFVDRDRAVVLFAPNLAWRGEALRDELTRRVGLPVVVENDANAMAWGEYRFGAGRGVTDLVCLTVGTGIGGGIVWDGRLYRGAFGIGAEFGHMQVMPDGHRCGCGNRGCWEQYASGRALVREARELAAVSPTAAGRLLELAGGRLEGIDGPQITSAAQDGDAAAAECFDAVGGWLGQGMASLAAVLDPRRFVVGGGVIGAGELLLGPARARYRAALTGRGHRPEADIVAAELGPDAGLIGAADLARGERAVPVSGQCR